MNTISLGSIAEGVSKAPDKKNNVHMDVIFLGGEGGIRTLGESPHAGFQDQYHQPLGHLSVKWLQFAIVPD